MKHKDIKKAIELDQKVNKTMDAIKVIDLCIKSKGDICVTAENQQTWRMVFQNQRTSQRLMRLVKKAVKKEQDQLIKEIESL